MASKYFQQVLNEMPEDVKIFSDKYEEITMRIYLLMKEKGMTQKALADHLGKKPSEISKWLHGGHNLTLKSIAKIEAVLEEDIITIPQRRSFIHQDSNHSHKGGSVFTVYKNDARTRKEVNEANFMSVENLGFEKTIVQQAV